MNFAKQPKDIHILLVDDDEDFRNILTFSFQRKGYQVSSASGGREAMKIVRAQPIDVVISDIRMPEGDGIELLDQLKDYEIKTPIVLLVTGFADISTEEAYDRGAEALFSKPFDRKSVEENIHRLLTPPAERWSQARDQLSIELQIKLQCPDLPSAIKTRAISIGRGGMFLKLEDQFPNISDEVAFNIITDDNQLKGAGIVRWVRSNSSNEAGSGCGIEFSYLAESARKQILEILEASKIKAYITKK